MGTKSAIGRPQWRTTALAIAAAVVFGVSATQANAMALGRVTVLSALGEPLRAEIDIPEINADEVASLKANIASPEAFKAAGLEYSPALSDVRITLEKRADGRYFLRLVSFRPVNDPFVDLILESSWASGRIVRDYTMLFDPPTMRQQQPVQAQAAPVPQPEAQQRGASAPPPARAPGAARGPGSRGTQAARAATPAAPAAPSGEGKQVTVQAGDTAGKIANANKPAAVSLDQMLVAMLRANPDAFANGNVNRLRAGAVLDMPSAEQAALVPTDEARQMLVAQSKDFNEFRRRLAEGVPTTKVGDAQRESGGKITAKVEEKRPTAAAPDKLTLSKGSAQAAKGGTEEKIAQQRAQQDAATRVAELNKNIADLNKLGKPSAPAAAGTAAAPASGAKPGIPVPLGTPAAVAKPASAPAPAAAPVAAKPVPAPAPAPAPAPVAAPVPAATASAAPATTAATTTAATAPAPASAAVAASSAAAPSASSAVASASAAAPASAPVTAAAAKPPAKPAARPPAPPPETSLLDDLLDNPLVLGLVGLVVAAGAGFGVWRMRQRKKGAQVDSSFLESRLQPDSFFGASGGQRIDTNEASSVTGSSMVYSPSQLDAAGDVDPVAEADVYLAYGRDLQAEEILKEALRTQPQRVAIHAKLLEIYAKRRDAKAFELIATDAYGITHGEGPEWTRICELGRELDPANSLYRPGGAPSEGAAAAAAAAAATEGSFGSTQQVAAVPAEAPVTPDLDLDLDFSIGDDEPSGAPAPAAAAKDFDRTQAVEAQPEMPALDLSFDDAPAPAAAAPQAAAPAPAPAAATLDAPDLVLDENSLSFDLPSAPAPAPAAAAQAQAPAPAPAADDGMLEFDLGGLSLDLPGKKDEPTAAASTAESDAPSTAGAPLSTAGFEDTGSDPLATKLALAQEFNAIGDPDGARTLAQEVIAEASGELKTAAQKFLAEIG